MANYKRKYRRTKVICTICTPHRNGNGDWAQRKIEQAARRDERQQRRDLGL